LSDTSCFFSASAGSLQPSLNNHILFSPSRKPLKMLDQRGEVLQLINREVPFYGGGCHRGQHPGSHFLLKLIKRDGCDNLLEIRGASPPTQRERGKSHSFLFFTFFTFLGNLYLKISESKMQPLHPPSHHEHDTIVLPTQHPTRWCWFYWD